MPKIIITNLGKRAITCNDSSKSILQHIHENFIDWMFACGGKGRCTTCRMIILEGESGISAPTEPELNYKNAGRLLEDERLCCQTKFIGDTDLVIKVPEQTKFPHVNYTE